MIKKNQSIVFFLLFLSLLSITNVTAFEPVKQEGNYSEIDWGVHVFLIYGSLDGNPVFIPQSARNLPRPELWIVMGGMGQGGSRNVSLLTYSMNETTEEFDILVDYMNFTMKMGDGGNPHSAMREIVFPTDGVQLRVIFNYLDILVEFYYKPIPIYINVETTIADTQMTVFVYIVITMIVGALCDYPARRLQRHATAIPGLPIISILAIATSMFAVITMFTYMAFPLEFFDRVIIFVLGVEPWLIEIPFFIMLTLWLGHRHSPDNLKKVQQYYSKFHTIGEKDSWQADMKDDYLAYEKNGKWYICDPHSWKEFCWRILGFRIQMTGHEGGIKPDRGLWNRNDQRIWVPFDGLTIEGAGLKPTLNKDMKGIGQTIGIVVVGAFCILLSGFNIEALTGLPEQILTLLGFGIILVGIFGRGSLLELNYEPHVWHFKAIKQIEFEQIMTQYVNFQRLRKQVSGLQAEVATISTNFHSYVNLFVSQFIKKINTMLTHRDLILKEGRVPDVNEPFDAFKTRVDKEKAEEEAEKKSKVIV